MSAKVAQTCYYPFLRNSPSTSNANLSNSISYVISNYLKTTASMTIRGFQTSNLGQKSKSSKSSSSSRYMARQLRDPFVKARQTGSTSPSKESESYLSRSAFKLIELDTKFNFINPKPKKKKETKNCPTADEIQEDDEFRIIVDLGASPGGWSQVLAQKVSKNNQTIDSEKGKKKSGEGEGNNSVLPSSDDMKSPSKNKRKISKTYIFALDILEMKPLIGVEILKGDFLEESTSKELKRRIQEVKNREEEERSRVSLKENEFHDQLDEMKSLVYQDQEWIDSKNPNENRQHQYSNSKVDVVLSDMMSNTSGSTISNITSSLDLCFSALKFSLENLKKDGTFVCKYFESHESNEFKKEFLNGDRWKEVKSFKPSSSRKESSEMYWVCKSFRG